MSHPARESIDWAVRAQALAEALPVERLHPRVLAEIASLPSGERWHAAFSGGADSLALLLLLWAHWPAGRARLTALHFNHRLRGAQSDGDAAFCSDVCAALGVRIENGTAAWPAGTEGVSEAAAREARLAFFDRCMPAPGPRRLLFLGHQKDDVAETMLMRLARGSGAGGLAAPRPVSTRAGIVHLRPLLGLTHATIVEALRGAGAAWREDPTNLGDRYFRTRVRSRVVPALREASPSDLADAMAWSRELLEEDDDALEAWADRVCPEPATDMLPVAALRECPRAVARRVLQRWLLARGGDAGTLGRSAFNALLEDVLAGAAFRRSAGADAFVRGDGVHVFWETEPEPAGTWEPRKLDVPGSVAMPDGGVIEAEPVELDECARNDLFSGSLAGPFRVYLGFEAAQPAWFAVRTWKPGDRYASLGAGHESKLQDHFTNRRIPKGMRHRLPVVADPEGRVLWVPGLPPGELARVSPDALSAVRLTYRPSQPVSDSSNA